MAMGFSRTAGLKPEINVTPLIDVLLVLIIIFLLIQPRHPHGLPSEVPQQATNDPTPPPASTIVLEIASGPDNKTVVRINATQVPHEQLEVRLREIFKSRAEKIMFVKGDAQLDFSEVAEVIDIARAADRDIRVGLITRDLQSAD